MAPSRWRLPQNPAHSDEQLDPERIYTSYEFPRVGPIGGNEDITRPGVAAGRLRSWMRQHGVPLPAGAERFTVGELREAIRAFRDRLHREGRRVRDRPFGARRTGQGKKKKPAKKTASKKTGRTSPKAAVVQQARESSSSSAPMTTHHQETAPPRRDMSPIQHRIGPRTVSPASQMSDNQDQEPRPPPRRSPVAGPSRPYGVPQSSSPIDDESASAKRRREIRRGKRRAVDPPLSEQEARDLEIALAEQYVDPEEEEQSEESYLQSLEPDQREEYEMLSEEQRTEYWKTIPKERPAFLAMAQMERKWSQEDAGKGKSTGGLQIRK